MRIALDDEWLPRPQTRACVQPTHSVPHTAGSLTWTTCRSRRGRRFPPHLPRPLLRSKVFRLQDIRGEAVGDPGRRLVHRLTREMRITRGGLDLAVAEQLADHRQGLPEHATGP